MVSRVTVPKEVVIAFQISTQQAEWLWRSFDLARSQTLISRWRIRWHIGVGAISPTGQTVRPPDEKTQQGTRELAFFDKREVFITKVNPVTGDITGEHRPHPPPTPPPFCSPQYPGREFAEALARLAICGWMTSGLHALSATKTNFTVRPYRSESVDGLSGGDIRGGIWRACGSRPATPLRYIFLRWR
jgi:hypothetical protein